MDDVRTLVAAINGLAAVQTTSYSKVDLDFVLNLNNYSSSIANEVKVDLISNQFFQCIPCDPASSGSSAGQGIPFVQNLAAQFNAGKPGHIPNDMRTHSFKIKGEMVLRRVQLCMDRLLYSNEHSSGSHGGISNTSQSKVSAEIYRVKGILHLTPSVDTTTGAEMAEDVDYSVLHSLQAVHQLFEIVPTTFSVNGSGDTTEGMNLFIVIGKNLDPAMIERELSSCAKM